MLNPDPPEVGKQVVAHNHPKLYNKGRVSALGRRVWAC